MRYAAEVIDLMGSFPERKFRMIQIVRHVAGGHPNSSHQWERIRKGVRRVLESLEESGQVGREHSSAGTGGFSTYYWKPGHLVVENRDRNRDNIGRTLAS